MKTPKVGKKVYLLLNGVFPAVDIAFTRADARENKGNGIVVDVPLTPFQQKRLQEITTKLHNEG